MWTTQNRPKNRMAVVDGSGNPVAIVHSYDVDANARLIAAAPDLYDVVPRLLAVIEDFMPNVGRCALQNYQELNEAPIAARAAIAKAEGGAS